MILAVMCWFKKTSGGQVSRYPRCLDLPSDMIALTLYLSLNYFTLGTLGCVWWIFWMIFVFDKPSKHPRISEAEKHFIEKAIGHQEEVGPSYLFRLVNSYIPITGK